MKSMNIAASRELVSRYPPIAAWWRWIVPTLPMWQQSSLRWPTATAAFWHYQTVPVFYLPVFVLTADSIDTPEGVDAVISGKEQEWLELEAAACRYEEKLLPPFFNTLSQYVEMGNSTFALPWASARRVL
jgi:ornithine decarboxylase